VSGFACVGDEWRLSRPFANTTNQTTQRKTNSRPANQPTNPSNRWINLVEQEYPEFIPHLSSCKSPQQVGAGLMCFGGEGGWGRNWGLGGGLSDGCKVVGWVSCLMLYVFGVGLEG